MKKRKRRNRTVLPSKVIIITDLQNTKKSEDEFWLQELLKENKFLARQLLKS